MFIDLIIPTSIVGGMGLVFGLGLSVASNLFEVQADEWVAKVREVLPGANCGACGQTGCDGFAESVVNKESSINGCPVGGQEVANKIAEILGTKAESMVEKTARVMCAGTYEKCKVKFDYTGIEDCTAAAGLFAGPSACSFGCVGLGNCVKACAFDAIVVKDGLAQVIEAKCKACGKCIEACPKKIIEMVPKKSEYSVTCSSKDKGAVVRKNCTIGCIGCGKCSKVCPVSAITVNGTLAKINTEVCTNCGECAAACPIGAIKKITCCIGS